MKISLSKKQADGARHVVLRCSAAESGEVYHAIYHDVLRQQARPVVSRLRGGDRLYRFNTRYLDRIMVTFPFAELSSGLERRMARIAMQHFADMPIPDIDTPWFTGRLYDFQKIGVGMCVERLQEHGVFMLNDEMGLGKTIQAICTALLLESESVLVVTTNSGKRAWGKILQRLFPTVDYTVVEGTAPQRHSQISERTHFTIVNVEAVRGKKQARGAVWTPNNPALFDHCYDLLVVDEFHRFKNPTSQQTQGFLRLDAQMALLMSGTPILNNPLEWWPALHKIDPERFPSAWLFEQNLAIKTGGRFKKIVGFKPEAMLELRDYVQSVSLRRRKDQVGVQMPKVVYSTVEVELTAEQRRLYNRIKDEFKLALASGEIKTVSTALAQITRLKQACFSPELYEGSPHSAKINELRTIVEELVASGEKAIIFSQWAKATRILQREFKDYNPAYVDGGVKPADRVKEEDRFNNDPECKLYIGTIRANQEAITLNAATYVILTDKEWTPLANDQAIARSAAGGLRGAGLEVPVNVIEMLAQDTFEERIEDLLARKRALFNATVERDAGAKVERITLREIRDLL